MLNSIREFLRLEAASGILLALAASLGLLAANTSLQPFYHSLLNTPFSIHYGMISLNKPLLFWINDGLMAIFFFLVGLEIKREYLEGHLSHPSQRILPGLATLGGILFPAIIYSLFNFDNAINLRGWAIPTATDIAFALGILSLMGNKIPRELRIFLLTIAVLDDLCAIIIIALFYSRELSLVTLFTGLFVLGLMSILNKLKVQLISAYLVASVILWVLVLHSGVHATIAGVLAAFLLPLNKGKAAEKSPLILTESALHPWVAYGILPLFAFANAGVSLESFRLVELLEPLPLGIMLGLFLGKQLGIMLGTLLPIYLKWARLPHHVSWQQIYGVSILCGIGFTMSLFIGTLAFEGGGPVYDHRIKLSVFISSFLSALLGYLVLRCSYHKTKK